MTQFRRKFSNLTHHSENVSFSRKIILKGARKIYPLVSSFSAVKRPPKRRIFSGATLALLRKKANFLPLLRFSVSWDFWQCWDINQHEANLLIYLTKFVFQEENVRLLIQQMDFLEVRHTLKIFELELISRRAHQKFDLWLLWGIFDSKIKISWCFKKFIDNFRTCTVFNVNRRFFDMSFGLFFWTFLERF